MLQLLFEDIKRFDRYWYNGVHGLIKMDPNIHHTQYAIREFDLDGDDEIDFDEDVMKEMVSMNWVRISVAQDKSAFAFQGKSLKVRRAMELFYDTIPLDGIVIIDVMSKTGEYVDHITLESNEEIVRYMRKGVIPNKRLRGGRVIEGDAFEDDITRYTGIRNLRKYSEIKFWYNVNTEELVCFKSGERVHHSSVVYLLGDYITTDINYDDKVNLVAMKDGWVRGALNDYDTIFLDLNGFKKDVLNALRAIHKIMLVDTVNIDVANNESSQDYAEGFYLRGQDEIDFYVRHGRKKRSRIHEKIDLKKTYDNWAKKVFSKMLLKSQGDIKYLMGTSVTQFELEDGVNEEDDKFKTTLFVRFINVMKQSDPTPNDKYVLWLIKGYVNSLDHRLEDVPTRIAGALEMYAEAIKTGFFKRLKEKIKSDGDFVIQDEAHEDNFWLASTLLKYNDLNKLSYNDLEDFTEMVGLYLQQTGQSLNNSEADRKLKEKLLSEGEAVLLHENEECIIYEIHTYEAMKFFGRQTRWCVAAINGGEALFDQYINRPDSRGTYPEFILCDAKGSNKKWLLYHYDGEQISEEDLIYEVQKYYGIDPDDEDYDPYDEERYVDELRDEYDLDELGFKNGYELRDEIDAAVTDPTTLPQLFRDKFFLYIQVAIRQMDGN